MLIQVITDSSSYKIGYTIGSWLPFVLLGIGLTIMILMLRKKKKMD